MFTRRAREAYHTMFALVCDTVTVVGPNDELRSGAMTKQCQPIATAAFPLVAAFFLGFPALAHAQLVVSANDAKVTLVDGVNTTVSKAPPDTVTFVEIRGSSPRILAEVPAPNSVVGPPQNVAVTPDRSLVLVSSSTKIDATDSKKTAFDDKLTVIDLQSAPPRVIATLTAGSQASGVAISPSGSLALVANRAEGTVSVFTIKGKTVTAATKIDLGAPESGPSGIAFTKDGRTALVTRNSDNLISVLTIDGTNVRDDKRTIAAGQKPYGIAISPTGDVAVVGNIGAGTTGADDTVSVVDLSDKEPRLASNLAIGPVVEGISMSPDGKYVAATVMNGSNAPKSSPLFHDFGILRVLGLNGTTLSPVAEAKIGHWCQGVAWSNSQTVLVQCMVEKEIQTYTLDGKTLKQGASIKINGGPAGIFVVKP
jgi:DNA-binding beta-propeller fold protein YncE